MTHKTNTRNSFMEVEDFDEQYILRLTRAAIITKKIPSDDCLVSIFGDGYEKNNGEAIKNWIKHQIKFLIDTTPKDHLEKILNSIDERIMEIQTN